MNIERKYWFIHVGRTFPRGRFRWTWYNIKPVVDVYAGRKFFTLYVRLATFVFWLCYDRRHPFL